MISGEVKDYHGPKLIINYFKVNKENINRAHFSACGGTKACRYVEELQEVVSTHATDEYLQELLKVFFADEALGSFNAPAAKLFNHNYLGPLEHTLEVIEICLKIAALYPDKIYKPLRTGAVFHDDG